jgi:50S ribosomal protein L16 3-hydroxylase
MLSQADLDLMIVREGARREDSPPSDMIALAELVSDGWTTLVRHSERHDARIEELAQAFKSVFQSPVDVHLYVTPPGRFGFSWHYDAEDVFILQTAGSLVALWRSLLFTAWDRPWYVQPDWWFV